jgi:hypothetical protein
MKFEIISKKAKPFFEVPQNKLIDLEKLKSKSKPIKDMLKMPTRASIKRKDLDQNWDQAF